MLNDSENSVIVEKGEEIKFKSLRKYFLEPRVTRINFSGFSKLLLPV